MSTLTFLVLLLGAGLFWLDSARARELATAIGRAACERRGMQFLDETVAFVRMGLRWTRDGLRIRRMFRFDFSAEGVGRRTGHVLLLGTRLETIDFGLDDDGSDDDTPQQPQRHPERKVVPFRRDH